MNWRSKPSNAAKSAAHDFYNHTHGSFNDDLEAFRDVQVKQRATADEIEEYQTEQEKWRDVPPPAAGTYGPKDEYLDRAKEKAEFAAREQEQERAAFAAKMERDSPVVAPAADQADDDTPNVHMRARFDNLQAVDAFMHGGKAIITVVSKRTKQRFTYKFARPKAKDDRPPPTFVSVLTGPDNVASYSYMGTMFPSRADPLEIVHTAKSHISKDAPSAKAAQWFVRAVAAGGPVLDQCEVWHEGRCGRCGRTLTVPESIASGFGPECINRIG